MDTTAQILQKAADHVKSCQTCSNEVVCDTMAEINGEVLKAIFSR